MQTVVIESRLVVASGVGTVERGEVGGRGHQRARGDFWGDGLVHCLDYGDGFSGVYTHRRFSKSYTLNMYSLFYDS